MRALLTAAALALLAGCSAPAAPAAPAAGGGAVVVAAADRPGTGIELAASCAGPAGIRVAHPAGWTAEQNGHAAGCSLFSAEPFPVVTASDVRIAAIALRVDELPFAEASAVLPDEVMRTDEVVDGRPAVRTEHVAGPGLWPPGTRSTRWVVDLGAAVLVADAVGLPPLDHETDVDVLDAMVQGLDLDAAA